MGWHIGLTIVYHTKFVNFFFLLRKVFVLLSKNSDYNRHLFVATTNRVIKSPVFVGVDRHRNTMQTTRLFYVLSMLLSCIFNNKRNVLFVCADFNYNYLPIKNATIFNRSHKKLLKFFNYFDIGVIIFMGLKKSTYLHRILRKRNVVCVVIGTNNNNTDICLDLPNNVNTMGMLYLFVLRFYLKSLS